MLKLIHCGDIHLGSKMDRLPQQKSAVRKSELHHTFSRMLDFAEEQQVSAILLCGDVFDSDSPSKREKKFFYDGIRQHPDIDFLYLRGNHDLKETYVEYDLPNLKCFGDTVSQYRYGDVCISGVEIDDENFLSYYHDFSLNEQDKNIVMLHGQIADTTGKGLICLPRLREKHIDYLALGHIHTAATGKLDHRGTYAYCGCLEGRGFDEMGPKGFVLLTIDQTVESTFVPFCCRQICEQSIDLSACDGQFAAVQAVTEAVVDMQNDLLRLNLIGEVGFDTTGLVSEVTAALENRCFYASVCDKTAQKINIADYENDLSLKGAFVRHVTALNLPKEEQQKILSMGLNLLSGREID